MMTPSAVPLPPVVAVPIPPTVAPPSLQSDMLPSPAPIPSTSQVSLDVDLLSRQSESKQQVGPGGKSSRSRPTPNTSRFDRYLRERLVGEGTYGQVYKGRVKSTGEIVAMKRIRIVPEDKKAVTPHGSQGLGKEGQGGKNQAGEGVRFALFLYASFSSLDIVLLLTCVFVLKQIPVTALREIKILQTLLHPNIVSLKDVYISESKCEFFRCVLFYDLTG